MACKIKIIGGNHDEGRTSIYAKHGLMEHNAGRHEYEFQDIWDDHLRTYNVSLGHYPMESNATAKSPMLYLCGHVHDKWTYQTFGSPEAFNINVNVGVDVWGMKPVSLETLIKGRDQYYMGLFNK
jgi:calcineurin-like phosphoesterase family protein